MNSSLHPIARVLGVGLRVLPSPLVQHLVFRNHPNHRRFGLIQPFGARIQPWSLANFAMGVQFSVQTVFVGLMQALSMYTQGLIEPGLMQPIY